MAVPALKADSISDAFDAKLLMNGGEESWHILFACSGFGVFLEVERTVGDWLEEVFAAAAFVAVVSLDAHGDTDGRFLLRMRYSKKSSNLRRASTFELYTLISPISTT